jgi:hypothetical protein
LEYSIRIGLKFSVAIHWIAIVPPPTNEKRWLRLLMSCDVFVNGLFLILRCYIRRGGAVAFKLWGGASPYFKPILIE